MKESILRPWQRDLLETVQGAPDNRTVYWLWETEGGKGQTWMSKYLTVVEDAMVLKSMKKSDMLQFLSKNKFSKTCVFDLSRKYGLPEEGSVKAVYEVAQALKDGWICSVEYECMFEPPHVIVFANFEPDRSKLSADMWNVIQI